MILSPEKLSSIVNIDPVLLVFLMYDAALFAGVGTRLTWYGDLRVVDLCTLLVRTADK
jgi:hypothetical protein